MHVVVVSGGDLQLGAHLRAIVDSAKLVICADGGAANLLPFGVVPKVLIGDLDSTPDETRRQLEDLGCEIIVYPRDKDASDTELAVQEALLRGATRLSILGALGGGRFDHALANVFLLTLPPVEHVDARILTEELEITLVRRRTEFHGEVGDIVSLLPLTSLVTGVTTDGLEYALAGDTLRQGTTHGLSNVLVEPDGWVEVESGLMLAIRQSRRTAL